MKRLKFKKPFNGMDNAKKLIPESYKVDGNEFEITDGNETYRVKWSSLINEGIILTSSNKGQINEDMNKIKHLMGFKSQDTLGTVKGADRLDENKKFGNILNKTKRLLNESEYHHMGASGTQTVIIPDDVDYQFEEALEGFFVGKEEQDLVPGQTYEVYIDDDEIEFEFAQNGDKLVVTNINKLEEGEHIKSGMGGSNKGKSRTDKTEVLKKNSKKGRRKADKEATKDINEDDVANFQDALSSNPKVVNAAKKLNTPIEKIEAADEFINNIAGDDDALIGKIIRAIKKDDSDVVNELENSELADLNKDGELSSYEEKRGSAIEKAMEAPVDETYEDDYYDFDDTSTSIEGEPGYNQSDINPIDTDLLSQIDSPDTMAGRKARKAGKSDVQKHYVQPKKGVHPLDPRKHALPYDLDSYGPDDLPTPPSEEEEQAAQVYEDRFDEVFEGMYEEDDIETLDEKDKITIEEGAVANWLAAGLITIGSIAGIGKVIQLDNEAQEAKTEYYQNVLSPKIGDTEQMSELGHEIQDQTREMGMSVEMITSLSQEEGGLTKFWAEFADTKLRKTPQDFSVDQSGTIHYTPK